MSSPGDARMPRAPAMPACLAPRRCPHASRPGDARMPRAPAMPACLAPRRCPHASRPGDDRMPRAPAMPDDTSPRLPEGSSFHYVTSKVSSPHDSVTSVASHFQGRQATRYTTGDWRSGAIKATGDHVPEKSEIAYSFNYGNLRSQDGEEREKKRELKKER
ncbi:hypothetical protein VNO80_18499 [Phaseolus coccineus]|uniref:Uncharacterized protein n=1 Tax=Phaseolus coccineus TaxID=3886 RepID=A0AAN9MEA3_PHACN